MSVLVVGDNMIEECIDSFFKKIEKFDRPDIAWLVYGIGRMGDCITTSFLMATKGDRVFEANAIPALWKSLERIRAMLFMRRFFSELLLDFIIL